MRTTEGGSRGSDGDRPNDRASGPDLPSTDHAPRKRTVGAGVCELCGGPTIERHCKIFCQRCGYQRDCSDP